MHEIPNIDIEVESESIDAAVRKWISGHGPVRVDRLKGVFKRHELEYIGCVP